MTIGYVADIKKSAKHNEYFRKVIVTGAKSQLVVMSLQPGEDIGMEVHDGDQVIYVVDGEGFAILGDAKKDVEKGSIVFVPAGTKHNVGSSGDEALKLFTIYAPPQHAAGLVQPKKGEATAHDDEPGWPEEAPPDVDSEDAVAVPALKAD